MVEMSEYGSEGGQVGDCLTYPTSEKHALGPG